MASQLGQPRWWAERGFWSNPYDTRPLGLDRDGTELLVGRDKARVELLSHLRASTSHVTIGGPFGGGKTSLVRCVMRELEQGARNFEAGQLLLPVPEPISPQDGESTQEFVERCLLVLSTTLVRSSHTISQAGGHAGRKLHALGEFVDEPMLISRSGGASALGFGGSGAKTVAANTGFGFQSSGFARLIRDALKDAFPADELGAVVACIDDIELCGGPAQVRKFLSDIRAPLLTLEGVKWIVVGADDVLRGVGDHPRLTGVISISKGLSPLPEELIQRVVERRIEQYHWGPEVIVPINGASFARLYRMSGGHLRAALDLCLEFAIHADDRGILDSELLLSSEQDGDGGTWLRRDVPFDVVEEYLDQISLAEWDRLVKLGAVAAGVLEDLAIADAIEAEILVKDDSARLAALKQLVDDSFVTGTTLGVQPLGIVRLTRSGILAIAGARAAGLL